MTNDGRGKTRNGDRSSYLIEVRPWRGREFAGEKVNLVRLDRFGVVAKKTPWPDGSCPGTKIGDGGKLATKGATGKGPALLDGRRTGYNMDTHLKTVRNSGN